MKLQNLCMRALTESMDVKTMVHLARRIIRNYDLQERTGFPPSVPIPNKNAARQIIQDCIDTNLFLEFVQMLVEIDRNGFEGRKYRIPRLKDIILEVMEMGYVFDSNSASFVEDQSVKRSKNWGVIREGEEMMLTFLSVDIAGNSQLVKKYSPEVIGESYNYLQNMVTEICEKRNGRIWNWEGDGGIAAFNFVEKNKDAVLSGMEILHNLFMYNKTACRLTEPLRIRIVIHSGPVQYFDDFSKVKSDTINKIYFIDSQYAKPQHLLLSDSIFPSLDTLIAKKLSPIQIDANNRYYSYCLDFEG